MRSSFSVRPEPCTGCGTPADADLLTTIPDAHKRIRICPVCVEETGFTVDELRLMVTDAPFFADDLPSRIVRTEPPYVASCVEDADCATQCFRAAIIAALVFTVIWATTGAVLGVWR